MLKFKQIPLRYKIAGLVLILAGLTNPLIGGFVGQGILTALDWGFQFGNYTAIALVVVTLLLFGFEYGRTQRNNIPTKVAKAPKSGMTYELQ